MILLKTWAVVLMHKNVCRQLCLCLVLSVQYVTKLIETLTQAAILAVLTVHCWY